MLTVSYTRAANAEAGKREFNDMCPDCRVENPPPSKSAGEY